MLHSRFKLITTLLVFILLFTVPVSIGAEVQNQTIKTDLVDGTTDADTNSEDGIMPISETPSPEDMEDTESTEDIYEIETETETDSDTATTPDANDVASLPEESKDNDVFYLEGKDVTIDYEVNGNAFIIANSVTINSPINGDVFVCANDIIIGENGDIYNNLFSISENLTITGNVVSSVYSIATTTKVNGYIYNDLNLISEDVTIVGEVGRNASISCSQLKFEDEITPPNTSIISGDLNYSAKEEISIPEGTVDGKTTFNQITENTDFDMQTILMSLGTLVATTIILWLLCLWLAPKFLNKAPSLVSTKKILHTIGLGILTPIASIFLIVLLLLLGLTTTVSILLLFLVCILFVISSSIFVIAINGVICDKLKIEKTLGIFGMLVASSAVYYLIGLIPFVGGLIKIIAFILGLGTLISSIVLKEKKKEIQTESQL